MPRFWGFYLVSWVSVGLWGGAAVAVEVWKREIDGGRVWVWLDD